MQTTEEVFLKKYTNKPVSTTSYAIVNLVTSGALAAYGIVYVHELMWKVFIIILAYVWIFRAIAEIVDVYLALATLRQLNRSFIQESEKCLSQVENLLQKEAEKR